MMKLEDDLEKVFRIRVYRMILIGKYWDDAFWFRTYGSIEVLEHGGLE